MKKDKKWVLLLDVLIDLVSHPEVGKSTVDALNKLIKEIDKQQFFGSLVAWEPVVCEKQTCLIVRQRRPTAKRASNLTKREGDREATCGGGTRSSMKQGGTVKRGLPPHDLG